MLQKQFDQKISNWSKVVNKHDKSFEELEQTFKDIDYFVKDHHTSAEQSGLAGLSKSQLERVKQLRKFVKGEMNKFMDYKYYFDAETKVLCDSIRSKKRQDELYANRLKVIKLFQKLSTTHTTYKPLKLHKLQKLLTQADRRIQHLQSTLIKPLSLAGKAQQASSEYKREINFFLIVAWIISFLLANKDPSKCLDVEIVGVMSFRQWLWANGGITLYLTVMLVIWDVVDSVQEEGEGEEEEEEGSEDQEEGNGKEKNMKKSKSGKDKQSSQKLNAIQNKYQNSGVCSCFSVILLSIGIIGKFFWIFFGIFIFLNQVDFDTCGDNVLNYCSLEFLAFFSFTIYGVISYFLSTINHKFKKPLKPYPTVEQLKEMRESQKPQAVKPEIKLSIQGNIDDLQDVLKRVVVWTLIGWVYDFVLFRKDHSQCLDQSYDNFSLTYRDWLLVDGIASLVTFAFSILLIVVFIFKHERFMIWQLKEQFFQINMSWMCNNLVLTILFTLIIAFKTVWLIVGVIVLCLNVNLGSCSGNVPNFLVAYFTESVYVIIFTFVSVVKGYMKRKSLREERDPLDESRVNLLNEAEKQSPEKNRKEVVTNVPKKATKEEKKNEKAEISEIQTTPMIRGSEKKLISEN